jgi:SP family facilitated glucose transporter-like MFS transporter 1
MDEMKQEQESMKLVPKVTLKEMLVNSSLRKPLIIAMMMMLAQQLSGINCAMFYSTSIFSTAGLNPSQSQSATLGMGAMNVAMTFVSLALIEKAGRKVLMVSGLSLMLCMTILLLASLLTFESIPTMSYVAIVAVITFVVGFATGPGSIPWFFVTELFAQSGRPTATSIAVVVNWTANFLVGLGFLPMRLLMGPWVFMVFIVIQLFFIVYVAIVVPETKGRQIDEITALFRK